MTLEAVIVDDEGQPFTEDRFMDEPFAAQEFLKILEAHSKFFVDGWEDLNADQQVQQAAKMLRLIEQDLVLVSYLRKKDKLQ